jgi:hypothetical protein
VWLAEVPKVELMRWHGRRCGWIAACPKPGLALPALLKRFIAHHRRRVTRCALKLERAAQLQSSASQYCHAGDRLLPVVNGIVPPGVDGARSPTRYEESSILRGGGDVL